MDSHSQRARLDGANMELEPQNHTLYGFWDLIPYWQSKCWDCLVVPFAQDPCHLGLPEMFTVAQRGQGSKAPERNPNPYPNARPPSKLQCPSTSPLPRSSKRLKGAIEIAEDGREPGPESFQRAAPMAI